MSRRHCTDERKEEHSSVSSQSNMMMGSFRLTVGGTAAEMRRMIWTCLVRRVETAWWQAAWRSVREASHRLCRCCERCVQALFGKRRSVGDAIEDDPGCGR